ncbi:TatD DNase family Scn1 [Roridomyces roridus]|uniref:TatD DNase family Scn1 n=1 Tax=Roridomyces roridus TaxID=1738132 RepID=A0AAD7FLL4_9AGAR|nr:TatD DNase family Scn1 [Roridomyces roridus]
MASAATPASVLPRLTDAATRPPAIVLRHLTDAHCHPTETPFSAESMEQLDITVCAMSTHQNDQSLVRDLALRYPTKIVPCFGYHPWFTHRISLTAAPSKDEHYRDLLIGRGIEPSAETASAFEELLPRLPEPITLAQVLSDVRHNLGEFPTAMLGEVGLDKPVRVAFDHTEWPPKLSPFTIPLDHQLEILEAQIDLAVELGRNISLHSVKCPQVTVDLLARMQLKHGEKFQDIRVDVHSCSLNPQVWAILQKRHSNVFISLSTTINGRSNNLRALIAAVAPNRLLIESDYYDIALCTEQCVEILNLVASVKGWTIEEEWSEEAPPEADWGAVRRLEANWNLFKHGK